MNIQGYLPGGEDRTQWIFEQDEGKWTEEMMQPLIDTVTAEVRAHREKFDGDDLVNYWKFHYFDLSETLRVFYATRCSWRFSLQSHNSIPDLAKKMDEYNQTYGFLREEN